MDMGIPSINLLNGSSVLGTPATRILRPTDEYYWTAPDHVFGEATAVVISAKNSDHESRFGREHPKIGRCR